MLKVGDKIIVGGRVEKVAEIVRITPRRAYFSNFNDDYVPAERHPASPESIAAVERADAERREKEKTERDERWAARLREREANPKLVYAERFANMGHENSWEVLSLDQLRQIAAWLDAAEGGGS